MRSFIYTSLFAVWATSAAGAGVCQDALYTALPCLKDSGDAKSLCSEATQTITTTQSTTILAWETQTVSQNAASQVTVDMTSYETTTVMETAHATTTDLSNINDVIYATMTTYVQANATAAPNSTLSSKTRRRDRLNLRADATGSACNSTGLLTVLSALGPELQATACSCLDLTIPTTTSTHIKTFSVPTTTTTTVGRASTKTNIWLAKTTETSTSTAMHTITPPCPTQTAVVTLAAPTFKHVHGPEAGCAPVFSNATSKLPAQRLQQNVTDVDAAATQCQDLCAQMPACGHVYVQHMFEGWAFSRASGGKNAQGAYFECYFGEEKMVRDEGLVCGLKEGVWGLAEGWDAVGRGMPEQGDD